MGTNPIRKKPQNLESQGGKEEQNPICSDRENKKLNFQVHADIQFKSRPLKGPFG